MKRNGMQEFLPIEIFLIAVFVLDVPQGFGVVIIITIAGGVLCDSPTINYPTKALRNL
jgi:hypothetical protein